MGPCVRKNPRPDFINLYFFENGILRDPEKLRVRSNKIEKSVKKSGKSFCYLEKTIHSLCGEVITSFGKIETDTPFVLVRPHEIFISCNYKKAFELLMKKRSEQNQKFKEQTRCKSAQAASSESCDINEQSCSDDEDFEEVSCNEQPKKIGCISKSKYPCSFDSEEDNCEAKDKKASESSPHQQKKASAVCKISVRSKISAFSSCRDRRKNSEAMTKLKGKNQSCFAKKTSSKNCDSAGKNPSSLNDCDGNRFSSKTESCSEKKLIKSNKNPCQDSTRKSAPVCKESTGLWSSMCVKKPTAKPLCSDGSRPVSRACNGMNIKQTQTTQQDIKIAKKVFKQAMKEEKKLLKLYGKDNKITDRCDKPINERDFEKARDKYRQKRKKMESQICKVLEKELRKTERSEQLKRKLKKQVKL